jgi:hypothetical protein
LAIKETIQAVVGGIVSPVASIFTEKTKRKAAQDAIKGKVAIAKDNNATSVEIRTADWELASKNQEPESWKDEYVTLSVFSLFNIIVFGSIAAAFGLPGGDLAIQGAMDAIETLDDLDGIIGDLMWLTAAAALSIKGLKSLK